MAELAVGTTHNVLNPNSVTFDERQIQLKEQEKREKRSS